MKNNVNAEVISIGTEILLGELTDTNSVFIAQQLRDLGINLYFMTSVGDNEGRISEAIRIALSRAQIVITCGGLGPTVDDMTRQSVAIATNRELAFHQELLDQIAARFERFRVNMTDNNRRQAYLPTDALVIENPVGTAPSFIVEHQGNILISLPGVPREMKYLMTEKVVPYLRSRYELGIIKAKTLKTAGIGESMLDASIGDELLNMKNPSIGLAAHNGQVDVRITAKADSEQQADFLIAGLESELRSRIGKYVYGSDKDSLENVLVTLLKQHDLKVCVCEAGIGTPVSEAFKKAGFEVSSEIYNSPQNLRDQKRFEGGIREVAIQAAQQQRQALGADVAISIVSLPEVEESADVEEATAVTVIVRENIRTRTYGFGAKSSLSQQWVNTWALATLWWMVKEHTHEA